MRRQMDAAVPDINTVKFDSIQPVLNNRPPRVCNFNNVPVLDKRFAAGCPHVEIGSKSKVTHAVPQDFRPVTYPRKEFPELERLPREDLQRRLSKTSNSVFCRRKTFEVRAQCGSEQRKCGGIGLQKLFDIARICASVRRPC